MQFLWCITFSKTFIHKHSYNILLFAKYIDFNFSIVLLCMYKKKNEEIKYKTSESADDESVNMRIFFNFLGKVGNYSPGNFDSCLH